MKNRILLVTMCVFFLVGCDFFGTSHTVKISYNVENKKIPLPKAPFGTYRCTVLAKGELSCDTDVQITMNSKPYKTNNAITFLGKGDVNKVIYKGDWYGSDLGVNLSPKDENCLGNKLEIKVVYFH